MRLLSTSAMALAMNIATELTAANALVMLTVEGAPTSLQLTAAVIAAMPHNTVSWTVHDKQLTCAGPWLADVLARAGVPSGEVVRGTASSTVVAATGADGYRAAFTIGELDYLLGNAPVIVADQCDGKPLQMRTARCGWWLRPTSAARARSGSWCGCRLCRCRRLGHVRKQRHRRERPSARASRCCRLRVPPGSPRA